MSKIRTRFAPSPTGYLHIGGARTALFAWLYAKSRQGECLLRIEDTDKTRSKNEYTEEIINSFQWLGITFDQETIFQSQNAERYKEMVDRLLENGSAYVCQGDDIEEDIKSRDLNLPRADNTCLLYTSPSPRDLSTSRMPSSA